MSLCEARKSIISSISEKKLLKIGRATDLIWLIFRTDACDPRGKEPEEHEKYSIHLQCTFRILKDDAILLGNTDIYIAGEGVSEELHSYPIGMSMFDQKVQQFNSFLPLIVTDVDVADNGDIRIELQNDFFIEVFIVSAMPGEFWRAFQHGNLDSHIVYESENVYTP
jgi:hypothetical protein